MHWDVLLENVVAAVIFGVLGVVLFAMALKVIVRVVPFSVAKEIAEDQNVALAIVLASIFLGLSVILAVCIH
jgi:uncharacterized membrane protein YjfL (UPF0719 family)